MSAEWVWTIVAGVALVVGLCGVVVPILPGLVLMWAVALAYGFAVGWSGIGVTVMIVATAAVAVSVVTGIVVPRRAAAAGGAAGKSQLAALAGAIVGFFVIPVVGVIVGALVGLFVAELARKGNPGEAWAATLATARGFGLSVLIDLGLGFILLAAWSVWALTVLL